MKVHEHKLIRQMIGIDRWRKSKSFGAVENGIGTFWWPTGMGKTYAGCILINSICPKKEGMILVQVPSAELENQWKAEIAHLVEQPYRERIIVKTVHSIHLEQEHHDVLLHIVDEVHEYLSEKFFTTLDGTLVTAKYKLGLTATWEDKENRHKKLEAIIPVIDEIEDQEAIDNGWISKFIEFNLAVELTDTEREVYDYLSEIISEKLGRFNRDLNVAKLCTYGGKLTNKDGVVFENNAIFFSSKLAFKRGWKTNLDLSDDRQYKIDQIWNPGHIVAAGRELFRTIKDRKDILYNARNKQKVAIELLQKYDTLKTICFSQSTKFADLIADKYLEATGKSDIVVYHSNLESRILHDVHGNVIVYKSGNKIGQPKMFGKTTLLKMATQKIRSGEARVISTASALDKGFDVRDIRMGLTTSGTANPTQYKQRGGRVKRVEDYEDDIVVLIINLYAKETRDEGWLNSRQRGSSHIIHWVDDIAEINYIPR